MNRAFKEGACSVWLIIPAMHVVCNFPQGHPPVSAMDGTLTDPATGNFIKVSRVFACGELGGISCQAAILSAGAVPGDK